MTDITKKERTMIAIFDEVLRADKSGLGNDNEIRGIIGRMERVLGEGYGFEWKYGSDNNELGKREYRREKYGGESYLVDDQLGYGWREEVLSNDIKKIKYHNSKIWTIEIEKPT